MMLQRLLAGFVVTAGMSLVAPAQEVRFETLEMRYHWSAPEVWLIDIAAQKTNAAPHKETPHMKDKQITDPKYVREKQPPPPQPTYRRIA